MAKDPLDPLDPPDGVVPVGGGVGASKSAEDVEVSGVVDDPVEFRPVDTVTLAVVEGKVMNPDGVNVDGKVSEPCGWSSATVPISKAVEFLPE